VNSVLSPDAELTAVAAEIRSFDLDGSRTARVIRNTFDQLYDGQRTGRYRWDQLYKTEKTHCGTLLEINLQREFKFSDGPTLDYLIGGVDVDCKYSQTIGGCRGGNDNASVQSVIECLKHSSLSNYFRQRSVGTVEISVQADP
jgi:Restriction endonuclease NaeI